MALPWCFLAERDVFMVLALSERRGASGCGPGRAWWGIWVSSAKFNPCYVAIISLKFTKMLILPPFMYFQWKNTFFLSSERWFVHMFAWMSVSDTELNLWSTIFSLLKFLNLLCNIRNDYNYQTKSWSSVIGLEVVFFLSWKVLNCELKGDVMNWHSIV